MDRRTLLAITLCFGIFLAWQKLYVEPHMPKPGANPQSASALATAPGAVGISAPAEVAAHSRALSTLPLATATGDAEVSDGAAVFSNWDIRNYHVGISKASAKITLADVTRRAAGQGDVTLSFDDPKLAYLTGVQGSLAQSPGGGLVWTYNDANVALRREVQGAANQAFTDLSFSAKFKKGSPRFAFVSVAAATDEKDPEERDRQLIYWTQNSLEREGLKGLKDKEIATPVSYIGAQSRYFLLALLAQSGPEAKGLVQATGQNEGRVSLAYPVSGDSLSIGLRVFFGPKELDLLRSVDPKLDHTVDLGFFTAFAYPLLKFLKLLYSLVKNYGVAIILLTLALKILTYPLTYKSMKSAKEMQRIQPQLQKLREKYKDDKEALNREMLTMMRSHGYNPVAGCLPMLIQIPIFWALYRVLYSSIELYHAPFAFWIHDLSARDPYYITPVVLAATMFLQQKITPSTATDPAQQKMLQLMPIIFGAMMIALPAGLTLYMFINSLATIVQQLLMNKTLSGANAQPAAARAR